MRALRLAVLTSAVLVATGCAVAPPDNTYAYKPGTAVVENVRQARVQIPGGTAPSTPLKQLTEPRWMDGYQLTLRMDDGTTQMITQDSDAFRAGERVEVTPQGRVLKLSANSPTPAPASAPVSVLVPGTGTVESVGANTASAATGASAAGQELQIRMDNGTTQWVNAQGMTFQNGDRVTITADGRITR